MNKTNGAATTAARECHDWHESHEHNRSCGPCKECRGTGKDLISYIFRSRKTRGKCPVCKGTGIRSQEFEQSNPLQTMEDLIEDMYLLIQSDFEEVMAEHAMIYRGLALEFINEGEGDHLCVDRTDDDDDAYWEMHYDLIGGKYVEKFEYGLTDYELEYLYEDHYSSFEECLQREEKFQSIPVWHQILDLDDEDQLDLYLHLLSIEEEL